MDWGKRLGGNLTGVCRLGWNVREGGIRVGLGKGRLNLGCIRDRRDTMDRARWGQSQTLERMWTRWDRSWEGVRSVRGESSCRVLERPRSGVFGQRCRE